MVSDYDFLPVQNEDTAWTSAYSLLIEPLWINFNKVLMQIR